MAKSDKKVWDEVTSVEPEKSTKKPKVNDGEEPVEGTVPFGSKHPTQQVIIEYRQHFRKNPPERRGHATAPSGNGYNYYLSSDVFDHADEFVTGKGCVLEMNSYVVDGDNIIQLVLEHIGSGVKSKVEANLGNPRNLADFGARFTYAPKYLIAIMFGVSVQTDDDAFGNGEVKSAEQALTESNQRRVETEIKLNPAKAAPVSSVATPSSTPTEPSKSYQKAREFIEKASVIETLAQARVKVDNSTQMTDAEKRELNQLIDERSKQLA